jgi:hypothetical protein
MKKFLSLILLVICISGYSQVALDSIKVNGLYVKAIKGPTWGYFWGGSSDTLNASDTLTKIIRVMGDGYMSGEFALTITKTSGTLTNKLIFYKSIIPYPYKWEKVDSIVNTNAITGTVSAKLLANWNAPFMKAENISPATAQRGAYKMTFIFRY